MVSSTQPNGPPPTFTQEQVTAQLRAQRRRHNRRSLLIALVALLALVGIFWGLIASNTIGNPFARASTTSSAAATSATFAKGKATASVDKFTEHATRDQIRALVVRMAQIHVRTINVLVEWRGLEPKPGHWNNYPWLRLAPAIAWYNHGHPNAPPMQGSFTLAFAPSWATGVPDQDCQGTVLCAPSPGHYTAYGLAARHISDFAHAQGNVPTEVWVGQQSNIAKLFIGGSPGVLTGMANAAAVKLQGTGTPVAIGELAPSGDYPPDLSPSTWLSKMINHGLKIGHIAEVVLGPTDHDTGWQGDKISRLPGMSGKPIGVIFNVTTLSELKRDVDRWSNNTFTKGTVGGYWVRGDHVSYIRQHLTAFHNAVRGR